METQGSSLSSLQGAIMSMVSNAGLPREAKRISPQATIQPESTQRDGGVEFSMQDKLLRLSKQLQEDMQRINTNIDFSYNEEIKGLVVTVRDSNGEKVIREIPSEEAIELVRKMRDMIGNILDERV
ncbi:flagellin protein [Helicobacter muridarum]|uniref:Flagellar protein FlaG n=1 Tax=Helicobacter muridarum TaxID=216 RepID=A0A377PR39_9HELI|nr:flagellar protein FlaG [Helicobacter muridarum]TLD99007.1 flagellin protein [Helicobacter muridarum]STQ85428.1 flagellar protein FlaG [Helicobacter muridarum]